MKQLDFSSIDVVRTAEREKRHDAFWGPLNETRRTAARVACDFFAFVGEVNWQLAQHSRLAASDAEKAMEAFIRTNWGQSPLFLWDTAYFFRKLI